MFNIIRLMWRHNKPEFIGVLVLLSMIAYTTAMMESWNNGPQRKQDAVQYSASQVLAEGWGVDVNQTHQLRLESRSQGIMSGHGPIDGRPALSVMMAPRSPVEVELKPNNTSCTLEVPLTSVEFIPTNSHVTTLGVRFVIDDPVVAKAVYPPYKRGNLFQLDIPTKPLHQANLSDWPEWENHQMGTACTYLQMYLKKIEVTIPAAQYEQYRNG